MHSGAGHPKGTWRGLGGCLGCTTTAFTTFTTPPQLPRRCWFASARPCLLVLPSPHHHTHTTRAPHAHTRRPRFVDPLGCRHVLCMRHTRAAPPESEHPLGAYAPSPAALCVAACCETLLDLARWHGAPALCSPPPSPGPLQAFRVDLLVQEAVAHQRRGPDSASEAEARADNALELGAWHRPGAALVPPRHPRCLTTHACIQQHH